MALPPGFELETTGTEQDVSLPAGFQLEKVVAPSGIPTAPATKGPLTSKQLLHAGENTQSDARKGFSGIYDTMGPTDALSMEQVKNLAGGASSLTRGAMNQVSKLWGDGQLGEKVIPSGNFDKESPEYFAGEMLDPVANYTGAKFAKLAGKVLPLAVGGNNAIRTIGQGALAGGATGTVTGALNPNEKVGALEGGIVGTIFGATLPSLFAAGSAIKRKIAPAMSQPAAQVAAGRMLNDLAGDQSGDTIRVLRAANQGPQMGGNLNVGQAVARENAIRESKQMNGLPSELAAAQTVADRVNPNPGIATAAGQKSSRQGLLGSFAGTPESVAAATEARDATINASNRIAGRENAQERAMREAIGVTTRDALGTPIQITGSKVPSTPGLEELRKNKGIQAAIFDAKDMAENRIGLPDEFLNLTDAQLRDIAADPMKSLEGLRLMKAAIDNGFDKASGLTTAASKIENESLTATKKAFMSVVRAANPEYARALDKYGQQSSDIFQQRVGQHLQDKLSKPLGNGESATVFANALSNEQQLLRKTGGFDRTDLEVQLTPENNAKIKGLLTSLDLDQNFGDLSKAGSQSAKLKDTLGQNDIHAPSMLNRAVTLGNAVLKKVTGNAHGKTLAELAVIMQDPMVAASMMEKATAREKNALRFLQGVMKSTTIGIGMTEGHME